MKHINKSYTELKSGYLFSKEELNRKITIDAVYTQFDKTGRFAALDCDWREGQENRPHIFWDSDVAKWIEGAAYSLAKHADPELEAKIDALTQKIKLNQQKDGYFNSYFTAVEPSKRFYNRHAHELYCAGHLIEAAIACDEIGKRELLECMEKYIEYIYRVFVKEKSARFVTPGHEEIELALLRLYRHNGNRLALELAAHFINVRGTDEDKQPDTPYVQRQYDQSHLPVREQKEAVGHAVRGLYLYTAMAMLAKETGDELLLDTCRALFKNISERKMYVTGGVGSTCIGEAFTYDFDLPNDTAYTETCAAISLIYFCNAMLENENDARYADVIERALYNGVLSGLSLDGERFFYTNPLEINLKEHFKRYGGERQFPITQRPEIFSCSCCPPNLNRLLASLEGYVFGTDGGTVFINQYAAADMNNGNVQCSVATDYPVSGKITVTANGAEKIALRIPSWCGSFTLNKPYTVKNGYAVVANDGTPTELTLDIEPKAVFADSRVMRDNCRLCIMRGPVVYCAEAIDNEMDLHRYFIKPNFKYELRQTVQNALPELDVEAACIKESGALYSSASPQFEPSVLHLIPYSTFANREECDMRVWINRF